MLPPRFTSQLTLDIFIDRAPTSHSRNYFHNNPIQQSKLRVTFLDQENLAALTKYLRSLLNVTPFGTGPNLQDIS